MKNDDLQINKGVELMLRRDRTKQQSKGFQIKKSITLLNKVFSFNFEITCGEEKKPT